MNKKMLGALGALTGGTLLPWILCGMAFGARTLMAVMSTGSR